MSNLPSAAIYYRPVGGSDSSWVSDSDGIFQLTPDIEVEVCCFKASKTTRALWNGDYTNSVLSNAYPSQSGKYSPLACASVLRTQTDALSKMIYSTLSGAM